jgi:hypothetical protein
LCYCHTKTALLLVVVLLPRSWLMLLPLCLLSPGAIVVIGERIRSYIVSYVILYCVRATSVEFSDSWGRAMAQAVSRRPPTAETRIRSRVSPCEICGVQSGTGTGFSPSTSVFRCQFHSTGAPLLGKGQKNNNHLHLHHRVAQEASRLRCVRSVCCGALHHY